MDRRVAAAGATYVDKFLRGAKPRDLPVEQVERFELVINLRTAKRIGLQVSSAVLFQADRMIEQWTGPSLAKNVLSLPRYCDTWITSRSIG